ncbi:MAG: thioredoxin family protein [Thermoplasmata archaeon]
METWDVAAFAGTELRRTHRVAVAFLAEWCPFCRSFRPSFEAWASRLGAVSAIVDLTSEESPLWESFEIEVVPTLALFDHGHLRWRRDGRLGRGLDERDLSDLSTEIARLGDDRVSSG